jgi:hypothetical protein
MFRSQLAYSGVSGLTIELGSNAVNLLPEPLLAFRGKARGIEDGCHVLGGHVGISRQPVVSERVDQCRDDDPVAGSAGVENRIGQPPGFIQIPQAARLRLRRLRAALRRDVERAGERGTDQGKPDASQGRPARGTGDQQDYRGARENQGGPIAAPDPGKSRKHGNTLAGRASAGTEKTSLND